jgi:hypothetical protein
LSLPCTTIEARQQRLCALKKLVTEFEFEAVSLVKAIIAEFHLPPDQRTYRPKDHFTGVAGKNNLSCYNLCTNWFRWNQVFGARNLYEASS